MSQFSESAKVLLSVRRDCAETTGFRISFHYFRLFSGMIGRGFCFPANTE